MVNSFRSAPDRTLGRYTPPYLAFFATLSMNPRYTICSFAWGACLSCLSWFTSDAIAEQSPDSILQTAIGFWQMNDTSDSLGKSISLQLQGACKLSVPMTGDERQQSIARGGDGFAAQLQGNGWLMLGETRDGMFRNSPKITVSGSQFTWLIRMRCSHEKLWSTRGILSQGGGHDALNFNMFSYDFGEGRTGMRLGFEIGAKDRKGLAGQVTAPVAQIGATAWHDVLTRYDGAKLDLFVDGVLMDSQPAAGMLRSENTEPIAIGAGTFQGRADNPFPGFVDHVAMWSRTLGNEEVVILSGGKETVAAHKARFEKSASPTPSVRTSELVEGARKLKERFHQDPQRPRYHFLHCEEGDAMPGDPNGAIWWNGRYHLFYIFQRKQLDQPKIVHCWGHASSVDLCHWEHHPTGLDVAPSDPDRGIFSGNALVSREGIPTLVYHGVDIGNCYAQSTDEHLLVWEKSKHNPIVPLTKRGDPGFGKYDSWDPHCWLEGDSYFAIFGGNPGTGSPSTLFRGSEIHQLKYVGPFLKNDIWSQKEEDVSCPDFFPLGNKHVLSCISHMRGARCFIGTWQNGEFSPEKHVRMNWPGGAFFAPESLEDDRGRRIMWAWCMDERAEVDRVSSGWSGVMSLPRLISLDSDGELAIAPVPELERLRYQPKQVQNLRLMSSEKTSDPAELDVSTIRGDCLELEIEMASSDSRYYGVRVRSSEGREEETTIGYDPKASMLRIDVSRSSLDPSIRYRSWCLFRPSDTDDANRSVQVQEVPLELRPGESLKLRIFIDHSMLEVFANGKQCTTQRIWPTLPDANRIRLFTESGEVHVPHVKAWNMAATTPD